MSKFLTCLRSLFCSSELDDVYHPNFYPIEKSVSWDYSQSSICQKCSRRTINSNLCLDCIVWEHEVNFEDGIDFCPHCRAPLLDEYCPDITCIETRCQEDKILINREIAKICGYSFDISNILIEECSQLFTAPETSFGRILVPSSLKHYDDLAVREYTFGKKYIFNFYQLDDSNWILVYSVREHIQNFLYLIYPHSYWFYHENNLILDFNFENFDSISSHFADVHYEGYNSLETCILLAFIISQTPYEPVYAIGRAKDNWEQNPTAIIPTVNYHIYRNMRQESKRKLLCKFHHMIFTHELGKLKDIDNKTQFTDIPFEEQVDNKTQFTDIPFEEKVEKLGYPRNLSSQQFLNIFPKLLNGNNFCAANSIASLAIYVSFILSKECTIQADVKENKKRNIESRIFMKDAVEWYRSKFSVIPQEGESSKDNLQLFFRNFRDNLENNKYLSLRECLFEIEDLNNPRRYDSENKVIPFKGSILDLVPNNSSRNLFGIHLENDHESLKVDFDSSVKDGKEIVAFIYNPSSHYILNVKYGNTWFEIDDINGKKKIDNVFDNFRQCAYVMLKRE